MQSTLYGKDRIKIIYVRPPYYYWPIINKSDNYLAPLNLPTIAAYIREKVDGVEQRIIDCMPLEIGYKTLYRMLEEEKPDIVGIGDMICYHEEGAKTLALAKQINPQCVTVAGGPFFSHMAEYSLKKFPQIDFIVKYEGEETFRELIEYLREGKELSHVRGIAYREGDRIVETRPRPLIQDLDSLPIPAYDMIPIEKYSPVGMLWRKAITIQGSRGCPYNCDFCTWSATEGEHILDENGKIKLIPRIRMKSPERAVEEVALLYEKYGIDYLFWVDATWNFDIQWLDKFSTEIIRRKYKIGWWAFTRADLMLEQEKAGVLEKMVKAGLRHCLFGAERGDQYELEALGKHKTTPDAFYECCRLLEKKYPQVFRQACFLVGIADDTPKRLEYLSKYTRDTHVDFAAIHPYMPYPGTPSFEKYKDLIEEWDFTKWDMFYPVMRTKHMSREEVAAWAKKISMEFINKQPWRYIKGMLSPHLLRRRLHWWFAFAFMRVYIRDIYLALKGEKKFEGYAGVQKLWKPDWYDS